MGTEFQREEGRCWTSLPGIGCLEPIVNTERLGEPVIIPLSGCVCGKGRGDNEQNHAK